MDLDLNLDLHWSKPGSNFSSLDVPSNMEKADLDMDLDLFTSMSGFKSRFFSFG